MFRCMFKSTKSVRVRFTIATKISTSIWRLPGGGERRKSARCFERWKQNLTNLIVPVTEEAYLGFSALLVYSCWEKTRSKWPREIHDTSRSRVRNNMFAKEKICLYLSTWIFILAQKATVKIHLFLHLIPIRRACGLEIWLYYLKCTRERIFLQNELRIL